MNGQGSGRGFGATPWRVLVWGALAALLALPLVAMQFTREVQWTGFDFLVMGAMLGLVGAGYEAAVRLSGNIAYQVGFGLAVVGAFLLVWMNLAAGIIGSEDNSANLMFAGVLAVGAVGALLGRLQARGMARAMVAMAVVQAGVAVVAVALDLGAGEPGWPRNIIGLTAGFVGLWLVSAWLFWRTAKAA
ncbi:hypothetical protein QO010_000364 [Caulobacter ginsengisoli]|uniref:DUF308 domain-containing protein n=1 Tax=Caulobacter ginsengisoli TaxID=400775 RepID=A0ABU0IMK4_9CAUL|nr:hypothetical protein [Caulobacter ginsengisoli]MDQ0462616.1 hypothetical protein [Caulobacter ginsengisoli]